MQPWGGAGNLLGGMEYAVSIEARTMAADSAKWSIRMWQEAGASSMYVGIPGGLVGGPCVYQDQFRGFKSHGVHARGFFLEKKMYD